MENRNVKIVSVRERPEIIPCAIDYVASKWTDAAGRILYEDCISHTAGAENALPNWFLAENNGKIIGCAGLIPNDFISRMDLMPWLCALFVEENERGRGIGGLLIHECMEYALENGFRNVYLCTDHIGYYERYGAKYMGTGYHPWNESSRIYKLECGN